MTTTNNEFSITTNNEFSTEDLLAAVHHVVDRVVRLAGGRVPGVGSPEWWRAGLLPRLAGLLVLAERSLIADPDRLAAEQLKDAAVAISSGANWAQLARQHVPAGELARRRSEPGPLARTVDPAAAARWAATGTSAEEVA